MFLINYDDSIISNEVLVELANEKKEKEIIVIDVLCVYIIYIFINNQLL